mmetsp:Transcript_41075/g.66584  ORF Transcript_41075/g.66584 Transcript_41075/m.66584 type:complete len:202 (+) Transcript_41075:162-767(+)
MTSRRKDSPSKGTGISLNRQRLSERDLVPYFLPNSENFEINKAIDSSSSFSCGLTPERNNLSARRHRKYGECSSLACDVSPVAIVSSSPANSRTSSSCTSSLSPKRIPSSSRFAAPAFSNSPAPEALPEPPVRWSPCSGASSPGSLSPVSSPSHSIDSSTFVSQSPPSYCSPLQHSYMMNTRLSDLARIEQDLKYLIGVGV